MIRVNTKIAGFIKDSLFYGAVTSLSALIGFVLLPFYTRIFTPEEYGVVEMITISISFINIMVLLNFNSAIMRYFYGYKTHEERSSLISTLLLCIVIFGILVGIMINNYSRYVSMLLFKTDIYSQSVKISAGIILLSALHQYFVIILRMERWKKEFGISQIGLFVTSISLVILLAAISDDKIKAVFIAQLMSYSLSVTYLSWKCRKYVNKSFSKSILFRAVKYSVPALPAVVSNWASSYINRYFIISIIGSYGVGIFSVGAKLSTVIMILIEAFRLGWGPFAMSLIGDKEQKAIYSKVLSYYFYIFLSVGMLVVLFSRDIIHILTAEQYHEAYKVVGLLIGGMILFGAFNITQIAGLMVEKTHLNSIAVIAGLTINVVVMNILLPKLGILGAAVASIAGYTCANVVMLLFAYKYFPVRYELGKISLLLFLFLGINQFYIIYKPEAFMVKMTIMILFMLIIWATMGVQSRKSTMQYLGYGVDYIRSKVA